MCKRTTGRGGVAGGCALVVWGLGGVLSDARAAVFEWTNPVSGNYIDAVHWTLVSGSGTAPPDVGDSARFNEAGSYEVRYTIDEASSALDLNLGSVTLRSFGPKRDYTVSGDVDIDNASLTLGVASDPLDLLADGRFDVTNGSANVEHGSLLRLTHFQGPRIGLGGNGFLTVKNPGSRLEVADDVNLGSAGWLGTLTLEDDATGDIDGVLRVASSSSNGVTGRVNVLSGADLETSDIEIAAPSSGGSNLDGRVVVDGAGSTITQSGNSTLKIGSAAAATASLTLTGGGDFTTGTGLTTVAASGVVDIQHGDFEVEGDIDIAGGSVVEMTNGDFDFREDLLVRDGGSVTLSNPLDIGGNHAVEIRSGATVQATRSEVGDVGAGDGTLLVDGIDSTLTATPGITQWGGGNSSVVTFSNDAVGTLGAVAMTNGSSFNETSTLAVESGARLSVGNLDVGAAGATGSVATITLSDSTTLLELTGAATLDVGHLSQGSATINLMGGAVLNTGAGLTTIHRTGTVNANIDNGGGVRLFGDTIIDGATLNFDGLFAGLSFSADDLAITLRNDAQLDLGFSFLVRRNATVLMESGADVTVSNALVVGANGDMGMLDIDGDLFDPATVTVEAGRITVGNGGGTGVMEVRDGTATASIVEVGSGAGPSTSGTLNIRSRGEVVASGFGLDVATVAGATTSGVVDVFFGGKLTVSGFGGIDVGHASLGSGLLRVRSSGDVTTSGTTNRIRSTGTLEVEGAFSATGDLEIDGGTVTVDSSGRMTANAITLSNGGTFDFTNGELTVGTFTGDLTSVAGRLTPGGRGGTDTYGITTIVGDYTQQAGGELDIELSGDMPILQHDLLTVSGTAVLDGDLLLSLFGFTPDPADTFTVFGAAGGIVGVFDNVITGQRLDTLDGSGSFQVNYGFGSAFAANEIVLSAFLINGILGDYNNSGQVEQGDLDLVLQNWGVDTDVAGVPTGWVNDLPSGQIEQTELDGVLQNWGSTAAPDFALNPDVVPEPATAGALLAMVAARRRRA